MNLIDRLDEYRIIQRYYSSDDTSVVYAIQRRRWWGFFWHIIRTDGQQWCTRVEKCQRELRLLISRKKKLPKVHTYVGTVNDIIMQNLANND
jgi:hypothetical protein